MVILRSSVWLRLLEGGLGTGDHVPPGQILRPCQLAFRWFMTSGWDSGMTAY